MNREAIIQWLLEGDVALQFRVHRDILRSDEQSLAALQSRIAGEGWAAQLLSLQKPDRHWGDRLYQPKWTSTFYTLLDLRYLCIYPGHPQVEKTLNMLYTWKRGDSGGINVAQSITYSDVCLQGMFLNIGSWFKMRDSFLSELVDFLLGRSMPDGGWNCEDVHGARKSSLHTTLSVLEGLWEYEKQGGRHRLPEIKKARIQGEEFLLKHQLYKSCSTGDVIDPRFLHLTFPHRWRYDILRALAYFTDSAHPYDSRMQPSLDCILSRRKKDGLWVMMRPHPGKVHFTMEETGQPSRWITFFALKVLECYNSL